MVGRDFVPNEDMGEWTGHMDAPEGTALEGTEELAFRVLKDVQGIDGVAEIEPIVNPGGSGAAGGGGGGAATHVHFNVQALPVEQRTRTQGAIIAEMRQRLAKYPGNRPSITSRNALGSGEGQGGYAISAIIR
jgi:multidrug efflux pump subunit AcrB